MQEIEKQLTIEDVERLLQIPRETVYMFARTKKLPGFKVGRHWRFAPKDIQAFLDGQRKASLGNGHQ